MLKEGGFSIQTRVRLSETDALGVVYYGQYFTYFDMSRLEMLRSIGVTLAFLRKRKLGFVAADASCRFSESARFDELLSLGVKVSRIGGSSVTYSHRVRRGSKTIAEGKVTDVLVDEDGKPVQIPTDIRARL